MEEGSPKRTQASLVYDRIREDILMGHLKPDEALRLSKLQARYETGGSPVREALNRLSANGMVRSHDNRGFFVPSITRNELIDLYKTRCWVEEIALRDAIVHGDVVWEEGIVLSQHRLSRVPRAHNQKSSNPDWEAAHRAFHLALVSACQSKYMMSFCHQLHDQSDRYRQFAYSVAPNRVSEQEHDKLAKMAIDRKADQAVELLREHYEKTKEIILQAGIE